MDRATLGALLLLGTLTSLVAGMTLDVFGGFGLGAHLAVQLPAGLTGMLASARWMDRRRQ